MPPTVSDETLRPRKGKWALMLLLCTAFVGGGFLMVSRPDSSSEKFWGYAGIAFFGLGIVIAIIQFIPGSSFLRLSSDGITVRTMWRSTSYRWSDIERFGVAEFTTSHGGIPQRHRLVGLDFSASYPRRDRAQTVKSINRSFTGFEGALPDNYGWDYGELAAHLNRLKQEYVSSQQPTHAA